MNQSTQTNLLNPLLEELSKYRGKRIFFEPLHGNNGDKLIEMGSREMLQKLGANLVNQPQQADAIVVNGGAGMTDIWVHGFHTLRNYNCLYPQTPLIVLPSSFWFTETNFASLFSKRVAPAFIYAREPYSLKTLKDLVFPGDVRLGIDHDMAFHLQDSLYIKNLQSKTAQKHILIVERNDPESVTGSYQSEQTISTTKSSYIPKFIKRPIRRYILTPLKHAALAKSLGEQGANTTFVQESLNQVLQDHPNLAGLPVFAADISNPDLCSFHTFSKLIAEAAVVVATRLHVGILAAMLDKPTYIKSGSYHKIRGIFEYSLVDKQNVRLV
ncbi:exopolysaccharide biosynthesis protein-like protein [Nostoc sp. NIES-4103]|nr:exopolysaccharide biosynthesis protein-like protein [Nostoc sp. NIES-4103]